MTIIVWDGYTLAADRLITTSNATNTIPDSLKYSSSRKIHLYKDKNFNGDNQLIAAGYAGKVNEFRKMQLIIEKCADKYIDDLGIDFIDYNVQDITTNIIFITMLKDEYGGKPGKINAYSLGSKYLTYDYIAIGCAKRIADILRNEFGFDAITIVKIISLLDPNCGEGIDYLRPSKNMTIGHINKYPKKERLEHLEIIKEIFLKKSLFKTI